MALDAGPFIRTGTCGSPSWPGSNPETGYVDADCSDRSAEAACRRGDCQESCVRGHSEATGGRAMAIKKGTLDELLSGRPASRLSSPAPEWRPDNLGGKLDSNGALPRSIT